MNPDVSRWGYVHRLLYRGFEFFFQVCEEGATRRLKRKASSVTSPVSSETMKPASVHHYFRPLKTFFRGCLETGLLSDNPESARSAIRARFLCPRMSDDMPEATGAYRRPPVRGTEFGELVR